MTFKILRFWEINAHCFWGDVLSQRQVMLVIKGELFSQYVGQSSEIHPSGNSGGGGGIRTPDTLTRIPVFKTCEIFLTH